MAEREIISFQTVMERHIDRIILGAGWLYCVLLVHLHCYIYICSCFIFHGQVYRLLFAFSIIYRTELEPPFPPNVHYTISHRYMDALIQHHLATR